MDLEMVLNELSLHPLARDTFEARERMANLLQTMIAATKNGVHRVVRTHASLDSEELSPNYPLARWRNDEAVDLESRRYFRSLITRSPFLEGISDPYIQNNFMRSDSFHNNQQAEGLVVAYWLEALAISLRSEARWDTSNVQITLNELDENGDMTESIQDIMHASSRSHIMENLEWIQGRLKSEEAATIQNGCTIWDQKESKFPNLYFCTAVEEQLLALGNGNPQLRSLMKKLHELEEYCSNWQQGPFKYHLLKHITPESGITLEMYGSERTFLCHDGTLRLFSWHARLTPNEWRLYFHPLPEERKLIIGYVGPHLRTSLFSH